MIDSDILAAARRGDTRAVARVLTSVENRTDEGAAHFASLFGDAGRAWITGVTGAPGSGKSTMVSALIPLLTPDEGKLAVVAVDPSSPFSGGAILGDRIRMSQHVGDDRVFIRSLANRGSLGGISESTPSVLAAMDGLGFDEIVVETVGVGQSEVEIATSADTTVVVVSPGWGDAIQVSKAGFLEVADVLVVNKADIAGADAAVRDLTSMLAIGPDRPWTPPVVMTTSTTGAGVSDLADAILSHRAYLDDSGDRDRRRRIRAARELAAAVRRRVEQTVDLRHDVGLVARVAAHEIDPWTAADILVSADGTSPPFLA